MIAEATVIKNAGSHFLLTQLPSWDAFPAVLRGKVRLKHSVSTNPIAVGDKVVFESEGSINDKNPALITQILPRRNYLIRRSTNLSRQAHIIAANLDRVVIVVSLFYPEIKLPFLDRILVSCEVYGIEPLIVLNKVDLYRDFANEEIAHFKDIYSKAGYEIIETSATNREGIAQLKTKCKGGLCLFAGESGVGKSSLIHSIDNSLNPKIGEISDYHLQGKHTTSLYEMYKWEYGYIIDAPGLRGFGLVDLAKEEIYKYFPEMLAASQDCKFTPCTHTHEPACNVKRAVDDGEISPERYNAYLGMLEEDEKFR